MSTHGSLRWGRAAAAACALALAWAATASGQGSRTDSRWQAWLGCWELADAPNQEGAAVPRTVVCVIPGGDAAEVEVVTIADGRVSTRETISAGGRPRETSREGCAGWERASWAPGGERVYLRSSYACGERLERGSSGMMAITPNGEWLDLQAVIVRGRTGLRVLRYRPAAPGVLLADEIAAAVQPPGAAVRTARLAAGAAIRPGDVVEASREVDPAIVQAWLAERGQSFDLDARTLRSLADAGVPGEVTDVMVALSYPARFQVNPASREPEDRPPEGVAEKPMVSAHSPYWGYSPYGWDYFRDPYYSWRYGSWSPYAWNGYGPYGYGWNPWSPYGYYGGAYGGWGWGGYWSGGSVVVVEPRDAGYQGGRIVRGRGYVPSQSGQPSGRQARPRDQSSGGGSVSSGGGSGSNSGGGSSSGARPASSSSGSSSSGSTGRTAHPRPPQ